MQSEAQIDQTLRHAWRGQGDSWRRRDGCDLREVIYQGAFGNAICRRIEPMTTDSVFWIASMTKAITTRRRRCNWSSRASCRSTSRSASCCPTRRRRRCWTASTPTARRSCAPAKRPITLRHLMTHTAGFCYDMWNGDMVRYLEKTGTPRSPPASTRALKTPLMTDPGTRWEYGINIDFVGKAVEAVERPAARRVSARQHLRAARHERHRLQDHARAARAAGRRACARRGRLAGADPVRNRAGARIPHGRRRALRHGGATTSGSRR